MARKILISFLLFAASLAFGAPAAPTDPETELIAHQLSSPNEKIVAEAIGQVHQAILNDPRRWLPLFRNNWLRPMLDARRYDEINKCALEAILAGPGKLDDFYGLQKIRVQALRRAGRADEALCAAKGMFNVASLHDTGEALLVLQDCLRDSNFSEDAIQAFRDEQVAGANLKSAGLRSKILEKIKIDAIVFRDTIAHLENGSSKDYQMPWLRPGLLLLADRPSEARVLLEAALQRAADKEKDMRGRSFAELYENIARSIKAEDGTVGRANVYVLQIEPSEEKQQK